MESDAQLAALGLPEKPIHTYKLYMGLKPRPKLSIPAMKPFAKSLGIPVVTAMNHVKKVQHALKHGPPPKANGKNSTTGLTIEQRDDEATADLILGLTEPGAKIAAVARKAGVSPGTAKRIATVLDGELAPLKRELVDIRLEDLVQRFGTLTRDAVDAITPEKLKGASAKDLAVIAGIAGEKWQLFRGQPTQRLEVSDRRQLNELLGEILKEAKRRNIEIDVTPEGEVFAKKSPYRDANDRDMMKQITTGDPAETFA